jgi:hypothetical protein
MSGPPSSGRRNDLVPVLSLTVGATVDSTAGIQAAIDACPDGQVVKLSTRS